VGYLWIECCELWVVFFSCSVLRLFFPPQILSFSLSPSLPLEDILDEVSGLTVVSPDDTLEDESVLDLENSGHNQADYTEPGQKVRVGTSALHILLLCSPLYTKSEL
jgi:hypothetical protein